MSWSRSNPDTNSRSQDSPSCLRESDQNLKVPHLPALHPRSQIPRHIRRRNLRTNPRK